MLSLHQCGDQLITWVGSDAVCLCRARRSGIETSGVGSVGHRRRADKRSPYASMPNTQRAASGRRSKAFW